VDVRVPPQGHDPSLAVAVAEAAYRDLAGPCGLMEAAVGRGGVVGRGADADDEEMTQKESHPSPQSTGFDVVARGRCQLLRRDG